MEGINIYANRYHDTTVRFQGFWKLMLVWKGSVTKLIWHDLLAFLVLYSTLSVVYRVVLMENEVHREYFELLCIYASRFQGMIPIAFLTGFYVTQVVARYWDQFMSLPWPDRIAFKLVSYIPGKSVYHRTLRRTVMRYVNLSTVLVFRLVAAKVHARFPSYVSLVKANLMLPHEATRLEAVDARTPHETTYIPLLWAMNLLQRERTAGKIKVEPPVYANLIGAFDYLEGCNRKIFNHGWVNFPLAYTQVATLSVFSYFFAALFGRQYLVPRDTLIDNETFPALPNVSYSSAEPFSRHTPDLYIPCFTILEFISYMGWIKVAETLLNPFGDDDEDFQINYLIDRNFQVSYLIVDEAMTDLAMAPDPFLLCGGRDIPPSELPYLDDKSDDENEKDHCCCSSLKGVAPIKHFRILKNRIKYRRAHRCQSTRSRLRSLNENRRPKTNYPRRSSKNKRVHRQQSEMSGISGSDHKLDLVLQSVGNLPVVLSVHDEEPSKDHNCYQHNGKVHFDLTTQSINDDNDIELMV